MWNASRFCVSSLRRGHANLLCIVPILVYVLPKQEQMSMCNVSICTYGKAKKKMRIYNVCVVFNVGIERGEFLWCVINRVADNMLQCCTFRIRIQCCLILRK